jgi:hypothetical protein
MYACSTNLEGTHSISQLQVALHEALLFPPMCPLQSPQLYFMLQLKFLVGVLIKEKMRQNVSAKRKNQATNM